MSPSDCLRVVVVTASLIVGLGCDSLQAIQNYSERQTLEHIATLFYESQHEAVVENARDFTSRYPLTIENASVLMFKAESEYQLGRLKAAVDDYQSALETIEKIANNVNQRRYAPAYFRLGVLLHERRQIDAAIAKVEAGLRLAPQHVEGQIQLGELLVEQGQRDRALRLYQTVLASSLPVSEERAVLGIKIDRLLAGTPGRSVKPADLGAATLYPNPSIGLLALNGTRADVDLVDICVVLEGSWRMRCQVLEPLVIADTEILVEERNQYDAQRIVNALKRRLPESSRPHPYILAVTNRDIFGPQTSFVFSWQGGSDNAGTGVLSTSRFVTGIPRYYEPAIIATRRVAVQALSSTGRMMDFSRPTNPECPSPTRRP